MRTNLIVGVFGGFCSMALIFGTNWNPGAVAAGILLASAIIGYFANKVKDYDDWY